jgi:hypothetical protein
MPAHGHWTSPLGRCSRIGFGSWSSGSEPSATVQRRGVAPTGARTWSGISLARLATCCSAFEGSLQYRKA